MSENTYLQVKDDLIAGILNVTYKPHERLPSQRELAAEYGLSHMTVRRAINELKHEGFIDAQQGRGLYVAQPKQKAELGPLYSFSEDMALRGMKATSRVLVPGSSLPRPCWPTRCGSSWAHHWCSCSAFVWRMRNRWRFRPLTCLMHCAPAFSIMTSEKVRCMSYCGMSMDSTWPMLKQPSGLTWQARKRPKCLNSSCQQRCC